MYALIALVLLSLLGLGCNNAPAPCPPPAEVKGFDRLGVVVVRDLLITQHAAMVSRETSAWAQEEISLILRHDTDRFGIEGWVSQAAQRDIARIQELADGRNGGAKMVDQTGAAIQRHFKCLP